MQIFFAVLTVLFIVVSIALVLIILVQRPQGGGLSGAFGGGGGTDTAFGGRTGDALTVATISAFAFLPGDYVAPAAVALAFVVALVMADA